MSESKPMPRIRVKEVWGREGTKGVYLRDMNDDSPVCDFYFSRPLEDNPDMRELVEYHNARENAAAIERAVNAHDALVAACEAALGPVSDAAYGRACADSSNAGRVLASIEAALTLAKGGER